MSTAVAGPVQRARELLAAHGVAVASAVPLPAGGNSRLWMLETADGRRCLVKAYRRDGRDRAGRETAALAFLGGHAVEQVPQLLAADRAAGIAVLSWVTGAPVRPGSVTPRDAERAADFLLRLAALRADPAAAALPEASEAMVAPAGYLPVIERRTAALERAAGPHAAALAGFFRGRLRPALQRALALAGESCRRAGVPWEEPLAPGLQTLSPSDFGFHNALRTAGGGLVFVDFEYFGWDDPAKAAADFFHQPAVPLPERLRQAFWRRLDAGLPQDPGRLARLRAYHLLGGVNWVLILLNPFLEPAAAGPAALLRERRLAAAAARLDRLFEQWFAGVFPSPGPGGRR